MNRICLSLVFVFLLGIIPCSSSLAVPPRNDWSNPEHSGGGDDDDPIKTSLSKESPPLSETLVELQVSNPSKRRSHPVREFLESIKTRFGHIMVRILKR